MNIVEHVNNDSKVNKIIKQFKLQNSQKELNIAFLTNPFSEETLLKIKDLYSRYSSIFIVGLTDKKEKNVTHLFNLGYDEIISLEESENVILSQLNSLIKEKNDISNKVIKVGDFEIPLNGSYPSFKGQQINFSEKEMEILNILAKSSKKPISKSSIHEIVYGNKVGDPASPKVIDVFICKIRKVLKEIGADGYIKTIPNQGYIIEPPVNYKILDEAV